MLFRKILCAIGRQELLDQRAMSLSRIFQIIRLHRRVEIEVFPVVRRRKRKAATMNGQILTRKVARTHTGWLLAGLFACLTSGAAADDTGVAGTDAPEVRSLKTDFGIWTGDFNEMVERRMVRVAVPYSRTLFYHDGGRERGLTAEASASSRNFSTRNTGERSRSGRSRWC